MDGIFRLRFEYAANNGETVRSDHVYNAAEFLRLNGADQVIGSKAAQLREKVVGAMREDGIIPPPSNVINVDFKRGKRA